LDTQTSLGQADFQHILIDALESHQVAGATVAIFDAGGLTAAAAGVTNVVTGNPMTTETIVHIGSICKMFNATLVMQLVDDGLLSLDECVLSYLPEIDWADRRAAENTTVRMLLNHTAGLSGSVLPSYGPDEETIEKGVHRLARLPRLFQPGEECSYSNPGTVIAGYIVQCLRKKSWYTVVRDRIFAPLQMKHAASIPEEYLLFSSAVGHFKDPATSKPVRTSRALLPTSYGPAGATLMMSATNLITFARAHMAGGVGSNGVRILSKQSTQEMQRTSVSNQGRTYWPLDLGIGWWRSADGLLNHNGGAPGVTSKLFVHPASNFAIAVLTNSDHGGDLANELILPFLEGRSTANVGRSFSQDDTPRELIRAPEAYEGVYEDSANIFRVSQTGPSLTLTRQAKFAYYDSVPLHESEPAPLEHIGDDTFVWHASPEVAGPLKSKSRIFQFRGSDPNGRALHVCNMWHLYKRRQQAG
jgi:CubicO group peptidase (beta-lactamase class C family)